MGSQTAIPTPLPVSHSVPPLPLPPPLDESQYMIRGDAVRLKHVLVHFLSNAIQQTVHPSRPQDSPPIVKITVCLSSLRNPLSSSQRNSVKYPISRSQDKLFTSGMALNGNSSFSSSLNPSCLSTVEAIHTSIPVLPNVSILVSDNCRRHKGSPIQKQSTPYRSNHTILLLIPFP